LDEVNFISYVIKSSRSKNPKSFSFATFLPKVVFPLPLFPIKIIEFFTIFSFKLVFEQYLIVFGAKLNDLLVIY
jgi:hypothetical protein